MLDVILDALLDTAKLLPFLFITYFAMEYLEHKAGDKTTEMVQKAGHFGPVIGGVLGMVPQCGFSAAASNLYAGRVITLGTLMAIFLSTSDEMLPILISAKAPFGEMLGIVAGKAVVGIVIGMLIDLCFRKKEEHEHIHELCEHEHCHCEESIFKSALLHTLQIAAFLLAISLILNMILHFAGEEFLAGLILNRPVIGPLVAALVGLIPNCAGSVVLTQLYLQKVISFGSAFGGLLTGSGVGLLVLFRVNSDKKENLRILGLLYLIGAVIGMIAELIF